MSMMYVILSDCPGPEDWEEECGKQGLGWWWVEGARNKRKARTMGDVAWAVCRTLKEARSILEGDQT
jgi:hypothetical protein